MGYLGFFSIIIQSKWRKSSQKMAEKPLESSHFRKSKSTETCLFPQEIFWMIRI